ncbi:MAG: BBP7 family outer membrane beta-barrel protein [Planctomycetia bacterium]|nr:BBP7 family outer membrane beta-barrel protein [Planctomycetia bacterium]
MNISLFDRQLRIVSADLEAAANRAYDCIAAHYKFVPSHDSSVGARHGTPPSTSCTTNLPCRTQEGAFSDRLWFEGEYLLWWLKSGPSPGPLVTTGNTSDAFPGALGQPGTRVLYGNESLDFNAISGGRFGLGCWLQEDRSSAAEVRWFLLGTATDSFHGASNDSGNPPMYIPVYRADPTLQREGVFIISEPGDPNLLGTIDIQATSRLWGIESNYLRRVCRDDQVEASLLFGGRYLDLAESLRIHATLPYFPGDPTYDDGAERFGTLNQFYGAQFGGRLDVKRGRFGFAFTPKLAMGFTHERETIVGTYIVGQGTATPTRYPGAYFAQPTNMGRDTRDIFAVVPELELKLSYEVAPHLRATFGYDFLYWSNVARPGNQIDRRVNATQTPGLGGVLVGDPLPQRRFTGSDFFAQGFSFGLEYRR